MPLPEETFSTPQLVSVYSQPHLDDLPEISSLATSFYTPAAAAAVTAAATPHSSTVVIPRHSSLQATYPTTSRIQSIYDSHRTMQPDTQHSAQYNSVAKQVLSRYTVSNSGSVLDLIEVARLEGTVVTVEDYQRTSRGNPASNDSSEDTFWPCTFNLSKVILGAGMMAIPKAFNLLGVLPGALVMVLMGCLTFFTLSSLVSASAATGAGSSYGALVRKTIGGAADFALQLAVLMNCWVMNIVFVVIIGDILLGTEPEYAGILQELLRAVGVQPASCWFLDRPVVLGMLSLVVLLPLSSMRSMKKLAVVNIIGVACNGLFAGLMLALTAGAAAKGLLKPPQLIPDWSQLGSTPIFVAMSVATIIPVLLNCDVCHQSLHPLIPLLKPYSVPRMQRLAAAALCICNILYFIVALCGGLVFGESLEDDVLTNVNAAAMGPLIGPAAAVTMSSTVRIGYLLSIIGSYVLLNYPLRQCIGDMLLPGGQQTVQQYWHLLTFVIVGSIYGIGCYLPSIWGALALVGSTASTVQAFIIPGLVVLSVERQAAVQARHTVLVNSRQQQQQQLGSYSDGSALHAPLLHNLGQHINGMSTSMSPTGVTRAALHCSWWRRLLRQAIAVLVVLLGVALFANSVFNVVWASLHTKAEGAAVTTSAAAAAAADGFRQAVHPVSAG
eukprot:GHRR01010335.1.p1 GENE.GHRR01010335.1~~GHRR01010335.1.p1  ORF type:complete len:668 (+),score=196.20 GHRR01010335.1:198-2201(+)